MVGFPEREVDRGGGGTGEGPGRDRDGTREGYETAGWAAAFQWSTRPTRRLHPHRPIRPMRRHRVRRFSFDPSHASEASGGRGCPERRQARSRDGCGPRASRPPRLVRSVWGRSTGSVRVRVRVRERGGGENEGASTSTKAASTTTRAKPPTQRPSRGRPTSPAGSPPKGHPTPPPRAKRVGEVPSEARGRGCLERRQARFPCAGEGVPGASAGAFSRVRGRGCPERRRARFPVCGGGVARSVGRRVRATGPPLPPAPAGPSGRPQPHLPARSPLRIPPPNPGATPRPQPDRTRPRCGPTPELRAMAPDFRTEPAPVQSRK